MVFSLPATSASGYFSNLSPGRRSAWIFAVVPARSESITARHTRSGCRQTACWVPNYQTLTEIHEDRRGVVSVFNGPKPAIMVCDTREEEIETVGKWLTDRISAGVTPHEIGVFVRSAAELNRGRVAVETAGLRLKVLDEKVETAGGYVSVCTMHLAKGLEFRAVVVMACDDEILPLQERIEMAADDTDLEEAYNTERHLLYVACTRARDHLLVTGVDPASEFLDDLQV